MSSPVAELDAGLQAMQGLKPPGVSGSRISALTTLCVANVQSESVLIQKLYTHFKRTPGTHKLGVLYVVDSVTRKWLEQAKQQGQAINSSAPYGTYAAGVNRVTELIPALMNDILSTAPADQKDKIKKLVDIWEKGQTFPANLIDSFKERLNGPSQHNSSTTPPGSPPRSALPGGAPAAPPAIPANISEMLANLAKQSNNAAPTPPSVPATFGGAPPVPSVSMPYQPSPQQSQLPFQMPAAPAVSQPPVSLPFAAAPGASPMLPLGFPGNLGAAAAHQQPPPQPQPQLPAGGTGNVQQNLMLIQALMSRGLSLDQISGILAQVASGAGGNLAAALTALAPAPAAAAPPASLNSALAAALSAAGGAGSAMPAWPQTSGSYPAVPLSGGTVGDWNSGSNDVYGHRGGSPGRGRGRSRSRSPGRYYGDGRGSPRGGRGSSRERGRGGRDYRQRSPPGGRHAAGGNRDGSPHREPPSAADKWVEHDPSLAPGTIRVLSRTLFVGGVTVSEAELRSIFGRFGDVQTCIVNKEKRHAFVKMYTRREAEDARAGMEQNNRSDENAGLRTRWGVGFGPRDCSDYSKGISVIPITKLTEADRKWMLTAPWGGSGGQPIETGLVVEEPDIEIGAGVSSKAISRRMQTDRGGINGPRSTRREEELAASGMIKETAAAASGGGGGRHSRRGGRGGGGDDRRGADISGVAPHGAAASLTGFPYGLTMGPNGMPVFPPGFQFPTSDQS